MTLLMAIQGPLGQARRAARCGVPVALPPTFSPARAGQADVPTAEAVPEGNGTWRFHVTVAHDGVHGYGGNEVTVTLAR